MSRQGGSEPTEKPTKRRRDKAREQGQVAKSNEINIAFSVILLFAFMYIGWDKFVKSASLMISKYLSSAFLVETSQNINGATAVNVYKNALLDAAKIIWPILLLAVLFGILVHVLQTGFIFTTKTLKPKFNRINPIEGFKRIFSMRSLVEFLKSCIKAASLCYVVYTVYVDLFTRFPSMMSMDIKASFLYVMKTAFKLGRTMGIVLAGLAMLDYLYQRLRHEKDLMMTKQEVKEEFKQIEGDPKVKSNIRRRQRQMSRFRMMKRMQEADVVITNPTHYAVAVSYKENEDKAPVVLAKGKDRLAMKIKETAREFNIEIVENKPVAQALYKNCELEQEIPKDMYRAVAEILVYVYKIKNKSMEREK